LRRRAFALLWGEDPTLTALFERLSDAVELLGFSGEAFTGQDALTGRDAVTGWIIRHEDSLVSARTLFSCYDRPDRTIRVSSRHGRAADVERFVIAAIADEVRLPVDAASLPLLETADVLMLPAPRPVMLWPPLVVDAAASQVPNRQADAALSLTDALEIFAAGKATYLVDRAVRRHTLTSLVVATDLLESGRGRELDAASAEQVANWVELTQGETAHVRERRRTGLSILVSDTHRSSSEKTSPRNETTPQYLETIESVLDGTQDWAQEWTPNRPFRNVFAWRPSPATSAAEGDVVSGAPGSADILRFNRPRTTDVQGAASAATLSDPNDGADLANLVHAMTQATTSIVHLQQLSARLTDLRRALSARFLRLHISNDPLGIVEWRRQICHVARNRLDRSAQSGGFGRLQRVLMFREAEAHAVISRLKVEDPRFSATRVPDLRTLEPGKIVEHCLEAWIAAMRQTTRAPVLMRQVQVSGPIVAHMVDELALGAMRIGLQEKLTEAVRRIQLSAQRAIDCENSVAALMERGINAFVETLDPGSHGMGRGDPRDLRYGGGQARAPTGARRAGARPAASSLAGVSPLAGVWAETFSDLVEANILGASLLGGAGHLNRELGEVLSNMSGQSFEGQS
jgi:hypothetical protein